MKKFEKTKLDIILKKIASAISFSNSQKYIYI